MIFFKTHRDNDEYYVVDARMGLGIIMTAKIVPVEIRKEAELMFNTMIDYERRNRTGYIGELAIRKNSKMGQYLATRENDDLFLNEDEQVDYEKIVNAFNIAVFENDPIASELTVLFRNQVQGSRKELELLHPTEIINYILKHDDFYTHLDKLNGTYEPKECFVYEDGEYSKKVLMPLKEKQKSLTEN